MVRILSIIVIVSNTGFVAYSVPLGHRTYHLGSRNSLTKIFNVKQDRPIKGEMRDPLRLEKSRIKIQLPKPKPVPRLKKKHAVLRFKPKRILGGVTDPRVKFKINRLGISRSYVPRGFDPVGKIETNLRVRPRIVR